MDDFLIPSRTDRPISPLSSQSGPMAGRVLRRRVRLFGCRISLRSGAGLAERTNRADNDNAVRGNALHSGRAFGLVRRVRERLNLPATIANNTILDCLMAMEGEACVRDRWRAGFESELAGCLSAEGRELGGALLEILAVLPAPSGSQPR